MASREYSARLGSISDEQLQAALDRFGLGRLEFAEPIANGLFGQNIMLTTSTGDYVFRGAPHWNPAGEDDWQFPKERFFSRLVHESPDGPPVAWPYLIDEGRDIFGWGFALQPRLPGAPLTKPLRPAFSEADIRQLAAELGSALAALHSVRVPFPGTFDLRTNSIAALTGTYADHITSTVHGILADAAKTSAATSPSDIEWAESILKHARPALELPFEPCVVHLDFWFHNVLFERRKSTWRLTGVIDWMTAEAGHPECDLARPLATDRQDQLGAKTVFLAAYFEVRPKLPGFEDRMRAFILWERALIWEYWQRNKGFREGLGMREWMQPFVEMQI